MHEYWVVIILAQLAAEKCNFYSTCEHHAT